MDPPPPPAVRLPPARGERDHQAAAAHQASAAPSAAAAAAPAAAADHPAAAAAAAAYPTPRQQQPQQTTQRQQQQQQQTTRRLQSTQRSSAQRSSGSSSTSSSTSSRPPEARLAFVHPLWPQVLKEVSWDYVRRAWYRDLISGNWRRLLAKGVTNHLITAAVHPTKIAKKEQIIEEAKEVVAGSARKVDNIRKLDEIINDGDTKRTKKELGMKSLPELAKVSATLVVTSSVPRA